jgi:hypothetical protein
LNGIGILVTPEFIREGVFVDNSLQGKGKSFNKNGSFYIGDFKMGLYEGQGEYYYSTKEIYKGQFLDNAMNG